MKECIDSFYKMIIFSILQTICMYCQIEVDERTAKNVVHQSSWNPSATYEALGILRCDKSMPMGNGRNAFHFQIQNGVCLGVQHSDIF